MSNPQPTKKKAVRRLQRKQKARKPNRNARRPQPRARQLTNIAAIIDRRIDSERSRLDVGHDGAAYINMSADPFADGSPQHAPKLTMVGFPDATAANTLCLCLHSRIEVSGATSTAGVISMRFDSTCQNLVENNYGTDPATPTNTPTAIQPLAPPYEAALFQSVCDSAIYWRLIAAGIKINPLTTGDNQEGVLWAWLGDGRCRTAAAVWSPYTSVLKHQIDQLGRPLAGPNGGITVRSRPCVINTAWHTFATFPANQYADLAGLAEVPHVAYDIGATTKMSVDAVAIFEIQLDPTSCPLKLNSISREPEWEGIAEFLNDGFKAPLAAPGHSFKQFWNTIKRVATTIFRIGKTVAPVVSAVAKLL
jgi:hypothetical protein